MRAALASEDAEETTKESLRRKWAQLEAMVGTDKRIALVAEDLVKHWEARYAAMEGKAMVVCMSRRICVELYKAIQKLRPAWHHDNDDKGTMKIGMSGSASDTLDWQKHIRSKKRRGGTGQVVQESEETVPHRHLARHVADRF